MKTENRKQVFPLVTGGVRQNRWWIWGLLLVGLLVLQGCAADRLNTVRRSCAKDRMLLAYELQNEAKAQLAFYFKQRSESNLSYAYHASKDSMLVARSVRSCFDFNRNVKREALDIIRINRLMQKLVVSNMRDQDPGMVAGLFGDQYREIFKNDIR